MKVKSLCKQLTNAKTQSLYFRQMKDLAENVYLFENLPKEIDVAYMNRALFDTGRVAFFKDEVTGLYCTLPISTINKYDMYGNPLEITVHSEFTGYYNTLKYGDFIIIYDNTSKRTIRSDTYQYATRIAEIQRTIDVNLRNQKTTRIYTTKQDNEFSLRRVLDEIDANKEAIMTYKGLNMEDVSSVLSVVPYVADKLEDSKEKLWNEFLRLIGVAHMSYQKKERNITDEVTAQHGGTIASRYMRYEARKEAIDRINEKWGLNIKVSFYDGLPTNLKEEPLDDILGLNAEMEDVESGEENDL